MNPTREQKLALNIDRHLAVTANAGSGKTRVLVDRYLKILFQNSASVPTEPKNVLAVTFTKNAAAEMTARAVREVEKIIANEKNSSSENRLKFLRKLRNKLSYARISTIHSFCTGLLRDYPIEAQISPNFSELSETDAYRMKDNAVNSVLSERISSDELIVLNENSLLFDFLKIADYRKYLLSLISNGERLPKLKYYYANTSAEEYVRCAFEKYKSILVNNIDQMCNASLNDIDASYLDIETSVLKKEDSKVKFLQKFDKLKQYPEIALSVDFYDNESICKLKSYHTDIFAGKIAGNSTFNSILKKYVSGFEKLKKEIDDSYSLLEVKQSENLLSLFELGKILLKDAEQSLLKIEAEKENLHCIDFEDMLIKAKDLLKDETVAAKVRKNIKYVLVDEFQDTNSVQYEIIKALVPDLETIGEASGVNLFVVGDAKQSIYRFRSADVRVFNKAQKDIHERNAAIIETGNLNKDFADENGINMNADAVEACGEIKLKESFRLQAAVASFVNAVSRNLMDSELNEFETNYEELVYARNIDLFNKKIELCEKKNDAYILDDNFGKVEFMFLVKPPKQKDAENKENEEEQKEDDINEAKMTAQKILDLAGENSKETIEKDGQKKKIEYGDIAVLSRSKKIFTQLSEALIQNRIPFVVQGGSGFFNSQEIRDVVSCVKFLHDPLDNLSLVSALKSPFFAFNENDLYNIYFEQGESYWEKLQNHASKDENRETLKLKRAIEFFENMTVYASKIPISQLVLRIIESGGWYAALEISPAKHQILANFEKLMSIARSFEKKGFNSLYDFVGELNLLEQISSESEASVVSGENVVRVLSVHSSKGQEYPVVIICNTNKGTPPMKYPLISEEFGLCFPFKGYDEERYSVRKSVMPITLDLAKKIEKSAEEAEEKRILYVAMTRAKERLVISATLSEVISKTGGASFTKTKGFLNYIESQTNMHLYSLLELSRTKLDEKPIVHLRDKLSLLSGGKLEIMTVDLPIEISFYENIADNENVSTLPETDKHSEINLELIPAGFEGEMFSATKLMQFESDQSEYYRRHILGITKKEAEEYQRRLLEKDTVFEEYFDISAAAAGTIIHETFEKIRFWLGSDGNIIEDEFANICTQNLGSLPVNHHETMKRRLDAECRNTVSAPLIRKNLENLLNSQAELNLTLPVGDNFLTGSIDCLLKNSDGLWEVWDWKSNIVSDDGGIERLKEHYSLQMKMYAYFVYTMYPMQGSYPARLLFTRNASPIAKNEDWTVYFEFSSEELKEYASELPDKLNKAAVLGFLR